MKKISILLLSSLVMILMACPNKDDDKKSDEDIKKENLSVTWKVNPDILPSSNPQGSFGDEFKQITLTFNISGTYQLSKPNSIPNSAAPANQASGNWKLSTDLTQVILDEGTSSAKTLDIETLTAGNFMFSFAGSAPPKYAQAATVSYNMIP